MKVVFRCDYYNRLRLPGDSTVSRGTGVIHNKQVYCEIVKINVSDADTPPRSTAILNPNNKKFASIKKKKKSRRQGHRRSPNP